MLSPSPVPPSFDSSKNIKVICRFRPQNALEISQSGTIAVQFNDDLTSAGSSSLTQQIYNFDKIFNWDNCQKDVFDFSASGIVEDVMDGYNGTIFAYGQTGAGKSYTMTGDLESDAQKGINPRMVEKLFEKICNASEDLEFTVKISYMEIYMERVRDLLNPANDNLPVHEEKGKGVYVKGLLEAFVSSVDEVFAAMKKGQATRAVGATSMNNESSRSHSIFVLSITQRNLITGSLKSSKLSLVDLAGSEKVGKTGASGQTLEEAKKINKSLSSLGIVINALTDGKSSHIPYRDSKLTRILQESLGGNSRTTLIINCSPSSFNEQETISTLRFGVRAKSIKNNAKINSEPSPSELKGLLKKAKKDITLLEMQVDLITKELIGWREGNQVPQSEWMTIDKGLNNATMSSTYPVSVPSTPIKPVSRQDRDDWLDRENEYEDIISEKSTEINILKAQITKSNAEIELLKERNSELHKQNKEISSTLSDTKLNLDHATFENKDNLILIESLKETNSDLIKNYQSCSDPSMQKILLTMNAMDSKEESLRSLISRMTFHDKQPPTDPTLVQDQYFELLEYKTGFEERGVEIEGYKEKVSLLEKENEALIGKNSGLDIKLSELKVEYDQLLEKSIQEQEQILGGSDEDAIEELKNNLELSYQSKREEMNAELGLLELENCKLTSDVERLKNSLSDSNETISSLKAKIDGINRDSDWVSSEEFNNQVLEMRTLMNTQLQEFDQMKKKLMRDVESRGEQVSKLEQSLDQNEESQKSQNQKLIFLERNLDQLGNVQKQLVEQNSGLKKQLALSEKKLGSRNDRISELEESVRRLTSSSEDAAEQYSEKIEQLESKIKMLETRSESETWIQSSRIAKPLRGGNSGSSQVVGVGKPNPLLLTTPTLMKRSSWYISLLKSDNK